VALIVLNPNETFEHSHEEPSGSVLLSGDAVLTVAGHDTALTRGVAVVTPARTSHTVTNTGSTIAVVECHHGENEEPPLD
jgi:mannose-6-phosphate isomerase-like protein (cupin superfamily)